LSLGSLHLTQLIGCGLSLSELDFSALYLAAKQRKTMALESMVLLFLRTPDEDQGIYICVRADIDRTIFFARDK